MMEVEPASHRGDLTIKCGAKTTLRPKNLRRQYIDKKLIMRSDSERELFTTTLYTNSVK